MDYKNQFVDENSYLVYGSEPDTAYDGSGGGGGGGGCGVFVMDTENATWDENDYFYTFPSITYGDMVDAMEDGQDIMLIWREDNEYEQFDSYCPIDYLKLRDNKQGGDDSITVEGSFYNVFACMDNAASVAAVKAKNVIVRYA